MPRITLPDGKNLNFSKEVNGLEIAEKISKSLSKNALVMSVDGELKDLYFEIKNDCTVKIFTGTLPWNTSNNWTSNREWFLLRFFKKGAFYERRSYKD